MHTVELLEEALGVARQLGYRLREEWLGEITGGACHINGQKWLFLDLALSPAEQLDQVATAIRQEGNPAQLDASAELRQMLGVRRAA